MKRYNIQHISNNAKLNIAIKNKNLELVKKILNKKIQINLQGIIKITKEVIESHKNIDIFIVLIKYINKYFTNNEKELIYKSGLEYSINFNKLEIVKLLLEKKLVDPSYWNNESIKKVSYNGNLEIVKLLLQDNRVNPADQCNSAIRWASYNGHLEIVKLLLQDTRVNPADNNYNSAIKGANHNGHLEIVKLLLQDIRVIERENLEIVKNKYPFEYIYYKYLKNRNARIIQRWYTKILYNPNSYYIRILQKKWNS